MVTTLQHVVFTKTDLLAVQLQSEKYFLVLTGVSGKDIKVENPWFKPFPHFNSSPKYRCSEIKRKNSVALLPKKSIQILAFNERPCLYIK